MKTPAASLLLALVAGCASTGPIHVEKVETAVAVDYRPYTEKGFLFTPLDIETEYESIGEVSAWVFPEMSKLKMSGMWVEDNPASVERLVQIAYEQAAGMGADALIRTRMDLDENRIDFGVSRTGYRLTGFAVKRRAR